MHHGASSRSSVPPWTKKQEEGSGFCNLKERNDIGRQLWNLEPPKQESQKDKTSPALLLLNRNRIPSAQLSWKARHPIQVSLSGRRMRMTREGSRGERRAPAPVWQRICRPGPCLTTKSRLLWNEAKMQTRELSRQLGQQENRKTQSLKFKPVTVLT